MKEPLSRDLTNTETDEESKSLLKTENTGACEGEEDAPHFIVQEGHDDEDED
jgi:hypothetical protein